MKLAYTVAMVLAYALINTPPTVAQSSKSNGQSKAVQKKETTGPRGGTLTVYFPRPWLSIDMPEALKERVVFVVDGREIGRVGLGERITVSVTPGTHYLRQELAWFPSISGALGLKGTPLKFSGQDRFIRVVWSLNHYEYDEVAEAAGRAEAAKCTKR